MKANLDSLIQAAVRTRLGATLRAKGLRMNHIHDEQSNGAAHHVAHNTCPLLSGRGAACFSRAKNLA